LDLFLVISQGVGLALATGLRPFLPPLLAGALARGDVGLDFDGTDFAFLESIPFLAAMVALTLLATLRRAGAAERELALGIGAAAVVLGALEFGGSLADEGHASLPGIAGGAACALVAQLAASTFLAGAGARLAARGDGSPTSFLLLYADALALAVAGLAILAPPVSYVVLAFALWVLIERRRRAGQKYEGLRILR
jgi:hypothetical protein